MRVWFRHSAREKPIVLAKEESPTSVAEDETTKAKNIGKKRKRKSSAAEPPDDEDGETVAEQPKKKKKKKRDSKVNFDEDVTVIGDPAKHGEAARASEEVGRVSTTAIGNKDKSEKESIGKENAEPLSDEATGVQTGSTKKKSLLKTTAKSKRLIAQKSPHSARSDSDSSSSGDSSEGEQSAGEDDEGEVVPGSSEEDATTAAGSMSAGSVEAKGGGKKVSELGERREGEGWWASVFVRECVGVTGSKRQGV